MQPHYPYLTRTLLRLHAEGALPGVADVAVEEEYGYVARVTYDDGSVRVTYGNDPGLNPAPAAKLARDKAYTKLFLARAGIECPRGLAFLLPWWAERIGPRMRTLGFDAMRVSSEALDLVGRELGYPVYVKPAQGSKGAFISRCATPDELVAALERLDTEHERVAVVEEVIEWPDYRLVVLDGEVVCAYRRDPPEGMHVSNLSLGGTAVEVMDLVAPRWRALAADAAHALGLRYCGVDLACADITDADAGYAVLEVNHSPGLDHYALLGDEQRERVEELYARLLAPSSSLRS